MFESARLKANWAEHNIYQLNANLTRFIEMGLGTSSIKQDPNTGQLFHEFRAKPFQIRVSHWVGDVIRNLRDALDHACSEVVRKAGLSDERVYFPIAEEAHQLKGTVDGEKALIKLARPELVKVILEEIKPTKAGNYTLWAMNKLQNADKHRALAVVVTYVLAPLPNFTTTEGAIFAYNAVGIQPGSTSNFPIPATAQWIDLKRNEDLNPPRLDITFGPSEFFGGKAVIPTLTDCLHVVSETLDAIERACS